MKQAVSFAETLANFYQNTLRNIPDDSRLQLMSVLRLKEYVQPLLKGELTVTVGECESICVQHSARLLAGGVKWQESLCYLHSPSTSYVIIFEIKCVWSGKMARWM
jgi:hypothetical protein